MSTHTYRYHHRPQMWYPMDARTSCSITDNTIWRIYPYQEDIPMLQDMVSIPHMASYLLRGIQTHGMMSPQDSTLIWIGTQIRTTRYGTTGPEIWCHMT